jgi:hypothetical protein
MKWGFVFALLVGLGVCWGEEPVPAVDVGDFAEAWKANALVVEDAIAKAPVVVRGRISEIDRHPAGAWFACLDLPGEGIHRLKFFFQAEDLDRLRKTRVGQVVALYGLFVERGPVRDLYFGDGRILLEGEYRVVDLGPAGKKGEPVGEKVNEQAEDAPALPVRRQGGRLGSGAGSDWRSPSLR